MQVQKYNIPSHLLQTRLQLQKPCKLFSFLAIYLSPKRIPWSRSRTISLGKNRRAISKGCKKSRRCSPWPCAARRSPGGRSAAAAFTLFQGRSFYLCYLWPHCKRFKKGIGGAGRYAPAALDGMGLLVFARLLQFHCWNHKSTKLLLTIKQIIKH